MLPANTYSIFLDNDGCNGFLSVKLTIDACNRQKFLRIQYLMNISITEKFSVLGDEIPRVTDLRNLEAPIPMERVLLACSRLDSGEFFLAHLPHVPIMLFPHLESRGLQWWVYEEPDESALVLIRAA